MSLIHITRKLLCIRALRKCQSYLSYISLTQFAILVCFVLQHKYKNTIRKSLKEVTLRAQTKFCRIVNSNTNARTQVRVLPNGLVTEVLRRYTSGTETRGPGREARCRDTKQAIFLDNTVACHQMVLLS